MGLRSGGGAGTYPARPLSVKDLWACWPAIHNKIHSRKTKFLFLDFDGTLTAIAKTPHAVVLKRKTRETLQRLSRLPSYRIAIVSGRSLKNLQKYFNLKNVIYVGNHGLEIKGQGLTAPAIAKKAKKLEALTWLLGEKLKAEFIDMPGVYVEDKNYTLSIHYRNISVRHFPSFREAIDLFRKKHTLWPFVWNRGKKVWEVRPCLRWGKGEAVLHLLEKSSHSLPIAIGDDVTDEDMFRAVKRNGITIRVGRSKKSLAEYYVKSPQAVDRFLKKLSNAKT